MNKRYIEGRGNERKRGADFAVRYRKLGEDSLT